MRKEIDYSQVMQIKKVNDIVSGELYYFVAIKYKDGSTYFKNCHYPVERDITYDDLMNKWNNYREEQKTISCEL